MTTQEQTDMAQMFPMPDGAKRLQWFVGEWTLSGTLQLGEDTLPISGDWSMTPVAGGWGVRSHLEGQIEGLGAMLEDDLLGFDQETGLVHLYSLTNTGNVHDHTGPWREDGDIDLAYDGTQQGQPYHEEIELRCDGDRRFTVRAVERVGGEVTSVMLAALNRK
ncbi:MAG: hypothetical protein AB7L91_05280 [Dehalococcoidia bacterium]